MCMEDYKLGRKIGFRETEFMVADGIRATILEPNENRIGFIVRPGAANGIWNLSTGEATEATSRNMVIDADTIFEIMLAKHGKVCCTKWTAVNGTGAISRITVLEFLWEGEEKI
jgi:hypothetical protein